MQGPTSLRAKMRAMPTVAWAAFGLAAAAASLLFVIAFFGTGELLGDEWDAVAKIVPFWRGHGFSWDLAWAPHNTHRVPSMKVLYYGLSFVSLDARWMMAASVLIAGAAALWLARRIQSMGPPMGPGGAFDGAFFFLLGLFAFHGTHVESFFSGMEICWFLATAGALGAIGAASDGRALATLAWLALSYFSLTIWFGLIPALGFMAILRWRQATPGAKSARLLQLGAFLAVALAAAAVYLHGIGREPVAVELSLFSRIWRAAAYFVASMGAPFSLLGFYPQFIMGAAALYAPIGFGWRLRPSVFRFETALWIFAVSNAALIAYGRSQTWQWGDRPAFRYSTIFLPIWMMIFAAVYRRLADRPRRAALFLALLLILIVDAGAKGLSHELAYFRGRTESAECLKQALATGRALSPSQVACIRDLLPTPNHLEAARSWHALEPSPRR